MKVEVKEETKDSPVGYPYVGISSRCKGIIVLFNNPQTGVVLHGGSGNRLVGDYSDKWAEETFTPFTGSVTLSN